jgi:hypothetical protein
VGLVDSGLRVLCFGDSSSIRLETGNRNKSCGPRIRSGVITVRAQEDQKRFPVMGF